MAHRQADAVTLTVTAPGASEVTILYRPIVADEEGDYVQLRKLIEPAERASGRFQTNLQTSPDFAGNVWAQVTYPKRSREADRTDRAHDLHGNRRGGVFARRVELFRRDVEIARARDLLRQVEDVRGEQPDAAVRDERADVGWRGGFVDQVSVSERNLDLAERVARV